MATDRYGRVITRTEAAIDEGLRAYMLRVYNYMTLALALTGAVAFAVSSIEPIADLFYKVQVLNGVRYAQVTVLAWAVLIASVILSMVLQVRIARIGVASAQAMFWVYAVMLGIWLAPLFAVYTGTSIARVFFITAAAFGALSLYGYTTKRDLSAFGKFLFIGLVGLILAILVNWFLKSSALQFAISAIGVFVFAGLTAHDTQAIKQMYLESDSAEVAQKKGILGALHLYLNFVLMFLFLLQFLGNRE